MTTFAPRRALSRILSLDDFEHAARRFLPGPIFAYVSGGAENTVSLNDNRQAFDDWFLLPRVLKDTRERSIACSLFGQALNAPFGIAPMGLSALSAYRGDIVQARAAARLGIPAILSGTSLIRMEDVAAAAPGTWFQAYMPQDEAGTDALLDRVESNGFGTLVVTVDVPVLASRENNIRAGFRAPLRPDLALFWQGLTHPSWSLRVALPTLLNHGVPRFENHDARRGMRIISREVAKTSGARDGMTWETLRRIRARWKGRLVIKGVLHPQDVALSRDCGADGVILSNHGGRQLDGAPSPLRMLPAAVECAGAMPVMIDSGFRRGTDILKALALGAAFVWIGRPFNYAAALAGEAGIDHCLDLLQTELLNNMALIGLADLSQIGPEHLQHRTAR